MQLLVIVAARRDRAAQALSWNRPTATPKDSGFDAVGPLSSVEPVLPETPEEPRPVNSPKQPPSHAELEQSLREILKGSCQELFRCYRLDLEPATRESLGQPLISQIHFGGGLTGRLTLMLARGQVTASLPIQDGTDENYEDWSRELVNQLMGLIKDRLLPLGFRVKQSLPASLARMSLPPPKPGSLRGIGHYAVHIVFNEALARLEAIDAEGLVEL